MPVATGVNEQGLRAVVVFLDFFPERWDQDRPGFCFASLTCWLAGLDLDELIEAARRSHSPFNTLILDHAAQLLGLSQIQAGRIFGYRQTPDGYHPTVEEFCERITEVTGVTFDGIL